MRKTFTINNIQKGLAHVNNENYLKAYWDNSRTFVIIPGEVKNYELIISEEDLPPFKRIEFDNIEEIKNELPYQLEFKLYKE